MKSKLKKLKNIISKQAIKIKKRNTCQNIYIYILSILGKLVGTFFFPPGVKPHFEHENRDKNCIFCLCFYVQNWLLGLN